MPHYTQSLILSARLLSDSLYISVVGADNSLWLRHRFDTSVERSEFEGDRIARATAVVPSSGTSADITGFHHFDTAGNFWRGTSKGVAVLHDGAWSQYSSEDGLIWDDRVRGKGGKGRPAPLLSQSALPCRKP